MGEIRVKRTVCMWCHSHCAVEAQVKDGKLLKLEENKEHPQRAVLTPTVRACPRARAAAEWLGHPDRLNYPLKRAGERGEGKWHRISWEQALDEIAEKLKAIREKYGPEAVAVSSGTYRTHKEYESRFCNLFGTPNYIGQGAICWGVDNVISTAITGLPCNNPSPQPGMTKCLLELGSNRAEASRSRWYVLLDAQKRGAKLIVVDPRYTETAQRADIWLQLRPGTDCALLMGMINVIINEELYDKEFVDKWCHGFGKVAERAAEYPPEEVAMITSVPADQIKEAARMYATNRPASTYSHMGLEHLANIIEALHAKFILTAITGNIDVHGGDLALLPEMHLVAESEIELTHKLTPDQRNKQLGIDRFKLLSLAGYDLIQQSVKRVWGRGLPQHDHFFAHAPTVFRAMVTDKPYPVKAFISQASNPLVAYANTKLVYKALKRLELNVVMDFWLTPSAELADYVLPSASWLERPFLSTMRLTIDGGEEISHPTREGEGERRTDYDFWRGLGIRLGQAEYWPWQTLEEAYDYRLAPLGYTLKKLIAEKNGHLSFPAEYLKYQKKGFATPTGKLELYSTVLERLGYDPLPRYEEPPESPISTPELAKEYPLILITGGRFLPMYHSEHRQIDSLRRQHPEPIAQLNPEKAAELGIKDGDWIWIETPRGRVRQKCHYFKGIDPRVVNAEHGWWFPELPGEEPWLHGVWESNINVVTEDDPEDCNRISGGWPLRALLCKVYPAKKY